MPKELEELIQQLPPATQNNARAITRAKLARIMKKPQHQAVKIINDLFGTDFDFKGNCLSDWGNEINHNE